MTRNKFFFGIFLATNFFAATAYADQLEIGFYGGANEAAHSDFTASKGGATDTGYLAWEGKSTAMPPFWGLRATWWLDSAPGWGLSFDYSHSKVYGDLTDSEVVGKFTTLEFTDGVNSFAAGATYRHEFQDSDFDVYAGLGVGFVVPHVEIVTTALANIGATNTINFQVAGSTVQLLAGASYKLDENWKIFGEAKLNYAMIDADLKGGGSFKTDIFISQIIVGVSYTFDMFGGY